MNPIDLLKLAEQAENEGRYAIADKLTNRAIKIAAALPMVYDSIAAAQAAARGAEESLGRAGVEGLGRASDEAAARYLGLGGDEASAAASHMVDKILQLKWLELMLLSKILSNKKKSLEIF